MWLGEKITDKGIGNGISLIIMIGIIARLPGAFAAECGTRFNEGGTGLLILVIEIDTDGSINPKDALYA